MEGLKRRTKKILIGVVGGVITVAGLIMIPYPGPGWLVVFAGLAILATEFAFAAKLLHFAKEKYDAWVEWLKNQNLLVRLMVLSLTGLVVVSTLWLLNAYGIIQDVVGVDIDWLNSPFLR